MKKEDLIAQIENTNDRLWSFDTNLICTVTNSNMSNDFNLAFGVQLLPGVHVLKNVPEPLFSTWTERYHRALEGEKFTVIDHFDIAGIPEYVEVSLNPIFRDNQVSGVACVSKDISDRNRAEIALLESRADLKAQIENTLDSIWSVNPNYELKTMNSVFKTEFSATFNCNLQLGDRVIDYLPEPLHSTWKERYDRALDGEHFTIIDTFEFGESPLYIEISYNPVKISNEIVGVACFTKNITALKSSEMQKKEALETRDKLFSVIAHDLRGPIANMYELTKLLEKTPNDDTQNEIIDLLTKSSSNVRGLLESLLKWSLTQRGIIEIVPQSINLAELVETSISPYLLNAELKKIRVKVDIKEDINVIVDKSTAASIIANLFGNATKYTEKEGVVHIYNKVVGNKVNITVKDNGIGMTPEKINDILGEKLITNSTLGTKAEQGTGIGLRLCKEFIELNGSELVITSVQDEGTAVSFALPLAND